MIGTSTAIAFFPESPSELTLLSQGKQRYQATCPILSKVILSEESQTLPMPFKLLNWNIYKQQEKSWQQSLQEWATSADILTLQEAKLSPELINFSKQNKLFYLQNYAFKHSGFVYGVNTLSKVEAISTCGTAHREPWIWVPKTGIASTYPIQGSEYPLLVINLHGINFTLTEKPLKKQIEPYLALIKTHHGPIIFSGDFNTWSEARLEGVEQSLIASGFSEALFDEDKRLTIFGLPLDHIFFRGLKVLEAQSLVTDSSDHSPQLVTFDLD
ncbi:EEP domain-containing protein [Psychromonas marina]|uniref:EEP domain-containing protein n=1 Tax=Psychromonas marina TaxID=88364 RepID=A0ABQ6DXF3_9GAMM|nr:EEP domain-containing protein [Psychromonas marina]